MGVSKEEFEKIRKEAWEKHKKAKDAPEFISDEEAPEFIGDDDAPEFIADEPDPYKVSAKGLLKGAADSMQFAGTMLGGGAGFLMGGPPGALVGAGFGTATGAAVENLIEQHLLNEPKTRAEIYGEPIAAGIKGTAAEAGGQIIGAGVKGLLRLGQASTPITVERMSKKAPKLEPYVPGNETTSFRSVGFDRIPKSNAQEIADSTARLGARATPGMLSANKNIQNLENVLSQQPTVAGEKVRMSYKPIEESLRSTSDSLVKNSSVSPYQSGQSIKQGLIGRVRSESQPLSKEYESIRESTSRILPKQENLNRSADRLMKQPFAEVPDLPEGRILSKYSKMIREAKSLDTLKRIRTDVNDEMTQAYMQGRGQDGVSLRKVKDAINRLERREIVKAAVESMPTKLEGEAAAKSLIDQMRKTNRGWAVLMTEIQKVRKAAGLRRAANPEHFVRMIEEMPSEKISERLFNTKNYNGLMDVKKFAPNEFELLKEAKLAEIAKASSVGGEINPSRLIKEMDKIGPEARSLLFGPRSERVLTDLKNVVYNLPKKVGASDTPRGNMWMQLGVLSPSAWLQEGASAYNYLILQGQRSAGLREFVANESRDLLSLPVRSTGGLLMMKNRGRERED